jgi:hypothetical protein
MSKAKGGGDIPLGEAVVDLSVQDPPARGRAARSAFPAVNRFRVAVLCGHAGC